MSMVRIRRALLAVLLLLALLTGCSRAKPRTETAAEDSPPVIVSAPEEAGEQDPAAPIYLYLGVEGYGSVDAAQKDAFRYRFYDGKETVTFAVRSDARYSIQNLLQEGRAYTLTLEQGAVIAAQEAVPLAVQSGADYDRVLRVVNAAGGAQLEETSLASGTTAFAVADEAASTLYLVPTARSYAPPVSGTPGERTLLNFLKTAMTPVGTTLYVYGGGWNWQDDGSSVQASSIGLPEPWVAFFQSQDASYDYKNGDAAHSYYPFGHWNEYFFAGADCSGYVGWALYNTFETTDGMPGYVDYADRIAPNLAARGWGSVGQSGGSLRPGDIMSMDGHVWISLGSCADGSIVIAHSTPDGGVQLSAVGNGGCEAYQLAQDSMTRYYPAWSARYPVLLRSPASYLSGTLFRWDTSAATGLADPDSVQQMDAAAALRMLFSGSRA